MTVMHIFKARAGHLYDSWSSGDLGCLSLPCTAFARDDEPLVPAISHLSLAMHAQFGSMYFGTGLREWKQYNLITVNSAMHKVCGADDGWGAKKLARHSLKLGLLGCKNKDSHCKLA